jgi:peroxiredoxin
MTRKKSWVLKAGGIVALMAVSYVLFYGYFISRAKEQLRPPQPTLSPSVLGKPLPQSRLVDVNGAEIDSQELQRGKVVLVSVATSCESCREESEFLRTVVGKRSDVRFLGVVSFGESKEALAGAETKFPFKLYFDEGFRMARGLGINRVPIKIYLEDGIVKKTWVGSTTYHHSEKEFNEWLDSLR